MNTTSPTSIIFFGSFLEYSVKVLAGLLAAPHLEVVGVVTTPPQPQGRQKTVTKTPVHRFAEDHHVPVWTPAELKSEAALAPLKALNPDLFLTAGYGKLLPDTWLATPKIAALNLHFSLLPAYRGANPAEWALLFNETQTGITLMEMSPEFDTGHMIAQVPLTLEGRETRESVYEKVYRLGGEMIGSLVNTYVDFRTNQSDWKVPASAAKIHYFLPPQPQPPDSPTPYARRLQRDDSFIDWSGINLAFNQTQDLPLAAFSPTLQSIWRAQSPSPGPTTAFIERAIRALGGYPGVWTTVNTSKGQKRLKILTAHLDSHHYLVLDQVQLEGYAPSTWAQIKNQVQ